MAMISIYKFYVDIYINSVYLFSLLTICTFFAFELKIRNQTKQRRNVFEIPLKDIFNFRRKRRRKI